MAAAEFPVDEPVTVSVVGRWARIWRFAGLTLAAPLPGAPAPALAYRIELRTIQSGFDGKTGWHGPRVAVVPGAKPVVQLTMQKALLGVSDVFFAVSDQYSADLGTTWSDPVEHATLGWRAGPDGTTQGVAGITPKWHAASGSLLGTGSTAHYHSERKMSDPASRPAYAVYDPPQRTWSRWAQLALPAGGKFHYASAGAAQRVDLPDGEILLPVHFKAKGAAPYYVTVMRCAFDGRTLTYVGHGDELILPQGRGSVPSSLPEDRRIFLARQLGLFEPSLTHCRGRYYLTMRNVEDNYVSVGTDGQRFSVPRRWTFDDGRELGSENTQTHWVTHSDGLFLTYTRRGGENRHVFRHRAPIFIAQVDPERLCLVRATERILVPERGASLGNFGVGEISAQETWVTTSESMHSPADHTREYDAPQKYGADNAVFAARILWNRPNRLVTFNPTATAR